MSSMRTTPLGAGSSAAVIVTGTTFADRHLPAVCAKTGQPATGWQATRATCTPGWVYSLLLFGVIPFFIAHAYTTRQRDGWVPVSAEVLRRRRAGRAVVAGAVAGALLTAIAMTVAAPELGWLLVGFGVLAVAAGVWSTLAGGVVARLRPEDGSVSLRRVHVEFARAAAATPVPQGEAPPR
jgi:hypothetical protein